MNCRKLHLYNMVKFYETYSRDEFIGITETLKLSPTVQLGIAQINESHPMMPALLTLNRMVEASKM